MHKFLLVSLCLTTLTGCVPTSADMIYEDCRNATRLKPSLYTECVNSSLDAARDTSKSYYVNTYPERDENGNLQ